MKKMRVRCVFVCLSFACLACGPTVDEQLSQAKDRMSNGKFREAISLLEVVLKRSSDNHDALNAIGVAYYNLDENGKALEYFDRALQLFQEEYKYYYNRGNVKRKLSQHAGAIEDYDKAEALDDSHYEVYLNRGLAKVAASQLMAALADFKKAATLSKEADKLVYYYQAKALLQNGQFEEAMASLTTALAIDPDFAEAYFESALVEFAIQQGPSPDMCTLLDRAINLGHEQAVDFAKLYCD